MNEDIRPHVAQQETLQGAPGGEQDEQDQQEFSHLPAISGERSLLSGIPTALACFIRLPPDASTSAETAAMHFVCAQLNQSTQSFPWMTPEGFETTTAATDPVWLGFLDSLDPTRVRRRPTNGTKTLETRMQGHPHGLSATPEYLAALRRHKTAPGNNDVSTIDSSSGITIPGPHSRNRPQLREFAAVDSWLTDTNLVFISDTSPTSAFSFVARPTELVREHAHKRASKCARRE